MPRGNQKGGKKHKRGKKDYDETKILRVKENGQEYAQITSCKGNCRFDVKCCSDGKERIAILCGKMRKRRFVNMRDIVLVSLRDFQDNKCDIIDTYDDNQVRKLKEMREIPEEFKLEEEYVDIGNDIEFVNDIPIDSDDEMNSDDGIDIDEI